MRTCVRCLLPEGKYDVSLDGKGTCNRCNFWDRHRKTFQDSNRLISLFKARLAAVRGKYPYDALVGVSGGKDSTYVLYKLVSEYGLKVLAVTFDNGFLTDYGKRNIESVVGSLGVEHFFIETNWEIHREFYLAALRKFGEPCIGCPVPGTFNFTRICQEKRIPFFIHGRSPYQTFRNYFEDTRDMYVPMLEVGLQEHSFDKVYALNKLLDKKARGWLDRLFENPEQWKAAYGEFFLDPERMSSEFAPEHLAFFLYHPYDEERMKQVLEKEVGYVRPESDGLLTHGDCMIHDAASYLFQQIHGHNHVVLEVATMLRHGVLTQDEGRVIIEREERKVQYPKESIESLCAKLGLDGGEFAGILENLKKNIHDKFDCR